MGKMLRLDKYLADMQVGSRTEVKQMIKKGQVSVDGAKALKPELKIDIEKAKVTVNGQQIGYAEYEYWMLHKPAGVVSATEDRHCKTVVDLLVDSMRKDLFPVGRLDKDTEGILLITNDGDLAHDLLSPKKHVDKTYYARIDGVVTEEDVKAFAEGLDIGEEKLTMPAELRILSVHPAAGFQTEKPVESDGIGEGVEPTAAGTSEIQVTIQEGKFHQVKRMFETVGKTVTYLKRLSMGSLVLDENLKVGEARLLTEEELDSLRSGNNKKSQNGGKTIKPVDKIIKKEANCGRNQIELKEMSQVENSDNYQVAEQKKEIQIDYNHVDAAIFDLDGTLIDSMWMWYKIDEEFLGQFGAPVPVDLQKAIEGMSFTETAEYFKERFRFLPYSVEQLKTIWNQMAYDKYAHEVTTKPGLVEFLTFLKGKAIRTGVATSNSRELVEVALENLGIRSFFDSIRTACEVEHGKPAPDIYLLVAEDLKARPEKCLVFEDVPAGIMAGNNAGMHTFAVADEFSAHMQKEKMQLAESWVEDYSNLLP